MSSDTSSVIRDFRNTSHHAVHHRATSRWIRAIKLIRAFLLKWSVISSRRASRGVKRGVDIIASATLLILLAPLFLIVATLIKLTDNGPVLFWQKRIGQWGCEFAFPKFRSMVVNAEALKAKLADQNDHGAGITFKMKKDPRVTGIGRLIRKLSIDELPQLWCVLRGDMSMVGPRPAVPGEVAQYTITDRRRLDAVPGLTCIWQVRGRGDIPFPEQVKLDREYIDRQSFWLDLHLMLQTIPAVLSRKGAY